MDKTLCNCWKKVGDEVKHFIFCWKVFLNVMPCFPCRGRCPAVRTAWSCSPCSPTADTKSPSLPSTQKGTDRRHRRSDEHVSRAARLELWDWSPVARDRDKHDPLCLPRPRRTADCGLLLLFRLNTDPKLKMSAYSCVLGSAPS